MWPVMGFVPMWGGLISQINKQTNTQNKMFKQILIPWEQAIIIIIILYASLSHRIEPRSKTLHRSSEFLIVSIRLKLTRSDLLSLFSLSSHRISWPSNSNRSSLKLTSPASNSSSRASEWTHKQLTPFSPQQQRSSTITAAWKTTRF